MFDLDTVLVVDDDAAIRHATTLRLSASGYDTLSASDGKEGVALARSEQPNVIVMDVRMPQMDGIAALRTLRGYDDTEHIPVVMLSASADCEAEALDEGAQFYLHKPYSKETLLAAVEAALQTTYRKVDHESEHFGH